jgi:hypothetical protein
MMKTLNELDYAKKLITSGFSRYMLFSDLMILAKYYRYIGVEEGLIWKELVNFCMIHELEFNENIHMNKIENAVKFTKKQTITVPMDIPITHDEIMSIRGLNNYRYEKVLFTMLFLGKVFTSKNSSCYYVNFGPTEILRMAHTTKKKNEYLFGELTEMGLIRRTKSDKDGYALIFSTREDTSPIEFIITNSENFLSFYPPYCKVCHKSIEKKSNRQMMCEDCFEEKRKNDVRNNVRKFRNKQCNQLEQSI